jgi:hypothetical protein
MVMPPYGDYSLPLQGAEARSNFSILGKESVCKDFAVILPSSSIVKI